MHPIVGVEILDVLDEIDKAFLADLALIGWHDRRVACGNVRGRIQDRVSEVRIVDLHTGSISEGKFGPIDAGEVWTARRWISGVACVAAHAGEEALTVLSQRHAAGRELRP